MSSATTTAAVERHTYWCHECDMSVSLLSSSTATSSLRCPHCSDFLEHMDSPLFNPNPNPNPNPTLIPLASLLDSAAASQNPDLAAVLHSNSDDNYLLDSPYLHRLIHHLTANSQSSDPSAAGCRLHSPTSKSALEAIPNVTITTSLLGLDPVILCAVCKDQFLVGAEVKQLPCKHMYHSDCILPWLSQHNSCPVCRFRLPTETNDGSKQGLPVESFDDADWVGFESTLRHIARRRRLMPAWRDGAVEESLMSPTQVGEAAAGIVERANSAETVSSWPSWSVEGGASVGGGGDGDSGSNARVNDDGDTLGH